MNYKPESESEKLDDAWLADKLKQLRVNPSDAFTGNVLEKLDIKPKQAWSSPVLWLLLAIPLALALSGLLFAFKPVMNHFHFELLKTGFSFLAISKYILLLLVIGLMLLGIDYYLSVKKQITFLWIF